MSVQAMAWVLESSKARLGDRLVALAVANHADREGENAWPSIETLALEAHLSQRQVQRALKSLESIGELRISPSSGPRGTNVYTLVMTQARETREGGDKLSGVTNCQGDKSCINDPKGGDKSCNGGVAPTSPEPSNNNHPEKIKQPSVRARVRATPTEKPENPEKRKRASRLPDDWRLPDEWRSWTTTNAPGLDAQREADRFADYWHAAASANAAKLDWFATWRNWVRRAQDHGPARKPASVETPFWLRPEPWQLEPAKTPRRAVQ